MNVDLMKSFVGLQRRKREMEVELRSIEDALKSVEPLVIQDLAAAGVGKIEVEQNGRKATIYTSSTAWPKMKEGVTRDDVINALSATPETEALVALSYNSNSFAAWCRERLGELKQPLPPAIDAVVELTETVRVGMRESSREQSASEAAMQTASAK